MNTFVRKWIREKEQKKKIKKKNAFYKAWPKLQTYRINPKYWDGQVWANSVDQAQTPRSATERGVWAGYTLFCH